MMLTALLVAQFAGTLELLDRTDVQARSTLQTTTPQAAIPATATVPATPATAATTSTTGLDVTTAPSAILRLHDRRWEFTLSYAPSVVLPEVVAVQSSGPQPNEAPLYMNAGRAVVGWHDRWVRLALSETASYGQLNSAFLTPAAAIPGQPPVVSQTVPIATTIDVVSSSTDAALTAVLDRRTVASVYAGYLVSGGANPSSREVLPEQYGPHASASLDYAASRSDHLTTTAFGTASDFTVGTCPPTATGAPSPTPTCSPESRLVVAQEVLRHALSGSASLTLGGGFAGSAFRTNHGDSYQNNALPVGQAGLSYRFGSYGTSTLAATAMLLPSVDPRTGLMTNRLQGALSLIRPLTRALTLRVTANAAQSVPTDAPFAATLAGGEVRSDFRIDPHLTLSVGDQAFWQDQIGYGILLSTFVYFALTVRTTELRF
jgi:hypothetical protein